MTDELLLGVTALSKGGRTKIPKQVMNILRLRYTPQKREKLLWLHQGGEVVLSKGTLESSFRKTILSRNGTAAVPRHIREILKLKSGPRKEERVVWIRKGEGIVVRKRRFESNSTD